MDNSLQAYIDRLPTEKIEHFIAQYNAGKLEEDYSFIIPYLQQVLERRREG